jgi:hypothetical protein
MIETYKRHDGEGLGANKVGEGSGENIPEPPKTHHKVGSALVLLCWY